jgi:hypothetical protein
MISSRHAPAVALLLAAALIPTVVHTYVAATVDDGRRTDAIALRLAGMDGLPTGRGTAWAREALQLEDAIERQYGTDLTLFAARSFDAKRLYHHPELVVSYGTAYDSVTSLRSLVRPDVPVHLLTSRTRFAAYVLLYDTRFVDDPVQFQFRNAVSQAFQPRRAMTLIFVHGNISDLRGSAGDSPPIALLLAAVDGFVRQQPMPVRGTAAPAP